MSRQINLPTEYVKLIYQYSRQTDEHLSSLSLDQSRLALQQLWDFFAGLNSLPILPTTPTPPTGHPDFLHLQQ